MKLSFIYPFPSPQEAFEVNQIIEYVSPQYGRCTRFGKIERIRGKNITIHVFKNKEKFIKNLLNSKRNEEFNKTISICPNHNHPLTSVFK